MRNYLNNLPYIEAAPEPNPLQFIGFKETPEFIGLQSSLPFFSGAQTQIPDFSKLNVDNMFTRSTQIARRDTTRSEALAYEQMLSTEQGGNAAASTLLSPYVGQDIARIAYLRSVVLNQDPYKALKEFKDSQLPQTTEEIAEFTKQYNDLLDRQMNLPEEERTAGEKDRLAEMTRMALQMEAQKNIKDKTPVNVFSQDMMQNPFVADLVTLGLRTNNKINELLGINPASMLGMTPLESWALAERISAIKDEDRSDRDIVELMTREDPNFNYVTWFNQKYSSENAKLYLLENGITPDLIRNEPNAEAAEMVITRMLLRSHIQERVAQYKPTLTDYPLNWTQTFAVDFRNSADFIPTVLLEAGAGAASAATAGGASVARLLGLRLSNLPFAARAGVYTLDTLLKLPAGLTPIYSQNLKLLGRMGLTGSLVGVGAALQETSRQKTEIAFAAATMYSDPDALKDYDFGMIGMAAGHGFLLGALGFGLLPATVSSFYGATLNKLKGVNIAAYGEPVLRSPEDYRFSFSGTAFGDLLSSVKAKIKVGKVPVDIPVNEKLALEAAVTGENITGQRLITETQDRVDRVETRNVDSAEAATNIPENHAAKRAVNESKEAWLLRIIPNKVALSFGEFIAEVARKLPEVGDNLNVTGDTFNELSLRDKFLVLAESNKTIARAMEIEKQTKDGITPERAAMYASFQTQRKAAMAGIRKNLTKVEWESLRKEWNQGTKLPPIPESIAKVRNNALGVAERKQAANELAAKVVETAREILANPLKASQLRSSLPKEVLAAIDSVTLEQATRGRVSETTVERIKADMAGEKPKVLTRLSAMYNDAIIANRLDPVRSEKIRTLLKAPAKFVELVEGNKQNATRFYSHINELVTKDMISTAERDLLLAATVHLNFDSKAFTVNYKIDRLLNDDNTINRLAVGRFNAETNTITINSGWVGSGLSAYQQRAMTVLHELGHAYFYHKATPTVYLDSLRLYNNTLDPNIVSFTAIEPVTGDPLLDTNFLTRLQLQNMEETFVQTFAKILTTEADVAIKALNPLQVSTFRSILDTASSAVLRAAALFDSSSHYKAAANIIDAVVDLDNKLSREVSVPELMRGYAKAMGDSTVDRFNQTLKTFFAQQGKPFRNEHMLTAGEYQFIFNANTDPSLFIALGIMKAQGKVVVDAAGRFTKDAVDLVPIYREYKKAQLNSMKSKVAFLLGTHDYKLLLGMDKAARAKFIQEKLFDISSKKLSAKSPLEQVLPATYEDDLFRNMKTADYLDSTGVPLSYAEGFLRTTVEPFVNYLELGEVPVPPRYKGPTQGLSRTLTTAERTALIKELQEDLLLSTPLIIQVREFFKAEGLDELGRIVTDAYSQVFYRHMASTGGVFTVAQGRQLMMDLYYSRVIDTLSGVPQRTFGTGEELIKYLKGFRGITDADINAVGLRAYLDGLPKGTRINLDTVLENIRVPEITETMLGSSRRKLTPVEQWYRFAADSMFKTKQLKQKTVSFDDYDDMPESVTKTLGFYGYVKNEGSEAAPKYVPDYQKTIDALNKGEKLPFQGYVRIRRITERLEIIPAEEVDPNLFQTLEYAASIKKDISRTVSKTTLPNYIKASEVDAIVKKGNFKFKDIVEDFVEVGGPARWPDYEPEQLVLPGGIDHKELLFFLNESWFRNNPFYHPHFTGFTNFIAHLRFNTRIGPNGERILFIEEIQSDLHQEGRQTGYYGEEIADNKVSVRTPRTSQTFDTFTTKSGKTFKHVTTVGHSAGGIAERRVLLGKDEAATAIEDRLPNVHQNSAYLVMEVTDPATGDISYTLGYYRGDEGSSVVNLKLNNSTVAPIDYWKKFLSTDAPTFKTKEEAEAWAKAELLKNLNTFWQVVDSSGYKPRFKHFMRPPRVPFSDTKAWGSLALNRALQYAITEGFDKIAWTSGLEQAKRYHKVFEEALSKITVEETTPGSNQFILEGFDIELGEYIDLHPPAFYMDNRIKTFTLDELNSILGRDMTGQILSKLEENHKQGNTGTIEINVPVEQQKKYGIGTKGYDETYDKAFVSEVKNTYNATPEKVQFGTGDELVENQPGYTITQEMREAILTDGVALKFDIAKLPEWQTKEDALNNIDHLVKEGVDLPTIFAIFKKNIQGNVWDTLKAKTTSQEEMVDVLRRWIANERIVYSEIQKKFIPAPKKRPAVDIQPGTIRPAEPKPPVEKAVLPAPKPRKTKKNAKQQAVEIATDSTVVTKENFWDVLTALYDENPQFVELTAAVTRVKKKIDTGKLVVSKKDLAKYLQTALRNQTIDTYKVGTMPVGVTGDGQGRKVRKKVSIETEEGIVLEGVKPFYTTAKMEESNNSAKARFKNLLEEMVGLNDLVDGSLLTTRDAALIRAFQLVEDMPNGLTILAQQLGKDRRTVSRWKANLIEKLEAIKKDLDIRPSRTITEEEIKEAVLAYIRQNKKAVSEAKSLPKPKPAEPAKLPSPATARKAGNKAAANLAKKEKLENTAPTPVTTPQAKPVDKPMYKVTAEVTEGKPEEVLRPEKQADAIIENDPNTVKEIVTFIPRNPLKTVFEDMDSAPANKLAELKSLALRAGYDALYFMDGTVLPLKPEDAITVGKTVTAKAPTGLHVVKIDIQNGIPVRTRIPDPEPARQETGDGTPVTLSKIGDVKPVTPKSEPTETVKTDEATQLDRKVNEEKELLRANGLDTSSFKRFLRSYWRQMKDVDKDKTAPFTGAFKLMWSKFVYINTEIFAANRLIVGDEGIAQFWKLVEQYRAEEKIKQGQIPGYSHQSDAQIFKRAAAEVNADFIPPVLPNELRIKVVDNEPVFTTKNRRVKSIVEQNKIEAPAPTPAVVAKPADTASAKQDNLPPTLVETQAKEAADLDGLEDKITAGLHEDNNSASMPLRHTNLVGATFGGSNRESRSFWRKLMSWEANAVQTASGTGRTVRSMQAIIRLLARLLDDTKGQTGHLAAAGKEMPKTALQCKLEEQFTIGRISERWTTLAKIMERYPDRQQALYQEVMKKIYTGQTFTAMDIKGLGITDSLRVPELVTAANNVLKVARDVNQRYVELGIQTGMLRAVDPNGVPVDAQKFLPVQFDADYLSNLSMADMEQVVAEMVKVRTNTKLSSNFLDINTMIVMGWLDVIPTPEGRRASLLAGDREFKPGALTNSLSPETLKKLELETHHKMPGRTAKGLLAELASSGKPQDYFVLEYPDKFVVYRLPKEVADLAPLDLQKYKETIAGNQAHYTNKWRKALNGRSLTEEEMRAELDFKTKRGIYGEFNATTSTNIDRPLITVGGDRETALSVPGLRPEEVFSSPTLLNITRVNLAQAYYHLLNGRMFQLLFQRELDKKFGGGVNMIHLLSYGNKIGQENIKQMQKDFGWSDAQTDQALTELRLGLSRLREEYAINADTMPYLNNPELYGHRASMALVKSLTAWGYGMAQMGTENLMVLARTLITNPISIPKHIMEGLRYLIGDYRFSKNALLTRSAIGDMAFNINNLRFEFGNRFLGETSRGAFSTDNTLRSRFIESRPSIGTRDKLIKGLETFGRVAQSVGSLQATTSWGASMGRSIVERRIWKHLKDGKLEKLMTFMSLPENKDLMEKLLTESYVSEGAESKLWKTFAKKVREAKFGYSPYEAFLYFQNRLNTTERVQHLKWLLEKSGVDDEGRANMYRMADIVSHAKQNPIPNINADLLEDVLSTYQMIVNQQTLKTAAPETVGLARITDLQLNSTAGRLWYALTSWLRGYHDSVILDYATKGSLHYIVGSLVMIGLFSTFSDLFREWLAGRDGEDILKELEEDPTNFAIRAAKSVPVLGPANGVIEAGLSMINAAQGGSWRYYGNPMGSIGVNSFAATGSKMARGIGTAFEQVAGGEFDGATFAAAVGDIVPINPIITRSPVALPVRTVESMVDADRQGALQKWLDTVQKEEYPYLSKQKRQPSGRQVISSYTPPKVNIPKESMELRKAQEERQSMISKPPTMEPTQGVSSVLSDLLKRPL